MRASSDPPHLEPTDTACWFDDAPKDEKDAARALLEYALLEYIDKPRSSP